MMLDAEMQAYVTKVDSLYPPDAVDLDMAGQRRVYRNLCDAFAPPHPKSIAVITSSVPGKAGPIPVRRYTPAVGPGSATVVYYHGGGFVVGNLDSHDSVCAEIADGSGQTVVSVDYRLAPEHVHPAHYDDALSALQAVAGEGRPVVVAGDSAGGNLAAAVAIAARGTSAAPIGQLLIYPGLGGDGLGLASYRENAEAIHLTAKDIEFYKRARAGGDPPRNDWTYAPLAATDFRGLAPCIAISADIDPLRDDCDVYVQRLKAAGVPAVWINEPGLVHGYLRARLMSSKAKASFARIVDGVRRLAERRSVG
ncbi:MAG: alpha/beta hydrolase [Hyphomicrobiaceae bacterium]